MTGGPAGPAWSSLVCAADQAGGAASGPATGGKDVPAAAAAAAAGGDRPARHCCLGPADAVTQHRGGRRPGTQKEPPRVLPSPAPAGPSATPPSPRLGWACTRPPHGSSLQAPPKPTLHLGPSWPRPAAATTRRPPHPPRATRAKATAAWPSLPPSWTPIQNTPITALLDGAATTGALPRLGLCVLQPARGTGPAGLGKVLSV